MFDGEERIDARHRFQRQRRHGRQLAARLGGDIGEHEELAPGMRPACVRESPGKGEGM
jgi:hypothetical protein